MRLRSSLTAAGLAAVAAGLGLLGCPFPTNGVSETGAGGTTSSTTSTATHGGGGSSTTTTTSTTSTSTSTSATTSTGTNPSSTTSSTSGAMPVCGDGKVDPGEQCDQGAMNSDTGSCLTNCMNATCGDGHIEMNVEQCDDGSNNGDTKACLSNCQLAKCGDGKVQTGTEQCDDGNNTAGDGCGPACQIEHPETCPGTPLTIATGQTLTVSGDTTGATDKVSLDNSGNCGAGPWTSPDNVFALTPSNNGMLTATMNAMFNEAWLHLRGACPGSSSDQIDCNHQAGGTATVTDAVTAGKTYYVIVDSYGLNVAGTYSLTLKLQ